jgi:hypothetical protein
MLVPNVHPVNVPERECFQPHAGTTAKLDSNLKQVDWFVAQRLKKRRVSFAEIVPFAAFVACAPIHY